MPTAFGTPEHWRERAKEARNMAGQIRDPQAKRSMLVVAAHYEIIAARAAILAGVTLPPSKGQ
jgi:hypothetical protein